MDTTNATATTTPGFDAACADSLDCWVPANGGTEEPFKSRGGKRLQYVFNPATGRHAYLDLDSDIILTDEEAWYTLNLY